MRINEEPPKDGSLKPAIQVLSWLTLTYTVGLVGYFGRSQGLWFWYVSLKRPDWDVPTWAFTPIYTILNAFIGVSLWLIWKEPASSQRSKAIWLVLVALILGGLSPWVYFAAHQLVASLCLSTILCLTLLASTIMAWGVKPGAGKGILPNLAWQTFAVLLEFAIWRLNK